MKGLKNDEITKRITFLQNLVQEKEKEIKRAPEGILNVARNGNRVQYYFKRSSNDKERKYLKKKQSSLIKALCQKDYDERVVESAKKELMILERLHNHYNKGICESIYEKMIPDRRAWIEPIEISDDEFVSQWLKDEYPKKGFAIDAPEYYTDNGEHVRSKSEILIANALKKYNIPYRYEAPLYLSGVGTIHPDFTVLNIKERKEYYWEHLGKLDDLEYISRSLQRIEGYERNKIFPGDKLILTHETLRMPINTKDIERVIFHYLLSN